MVQEHTIICLSIIDHMNQRTKNVTSVMLSYAILLFQEELGKEAAVGARASLPCYVDAAHCGEEPSGHSHIHRPCHHFRRSFLRYLDMEPIYRSPVCRACQETLKGTANVSSCTMDYPE